MINNTVHQVILPGGLSNYANHKKHFPSSHVISICDAGDRPLVVQFAASNARDFADAAELVAPFADGVDLNCGCPQRYEGEPSVEFVRTRRQKGDPSFAPFPLQLLAIWSCVPILGGGLGMRPDLSMELYIHKAVIFMLQISIPSPLTHTDGQWLRAMVPI